MLMSVVGCTVGNFKVCCCCCSGISVVDIARDISAATEVGVCKALFKELLKRREFDISGLELTSVNNGYNIIHFFALSYGADEMMQLVLEAITAANPTQSSRQLCPKCCQLLAQQDTKHQRTPLHLAAALRGAHDPSFLYLLDFDNTYCGGRAAVLPDRFGTTAVRIHLKFMIHYNHTIVQLYR